MVLGGWAFSYERGTPVVPWNVRDLSYIWQVDLYVAHVLHGYENLTAPTPRSGPCRSSRGGPDGLSKHTGPSGQDLLAQDWGPLGVPTFYQMRVAGVLGFSPPGPSMRVRFGGAVERIWHV